MVALLLKVLLSYLLGSVSGSLTLGALRHVDIRGSGSGNAGGTNAFRTQGFWFALAVVIIDIGKGALAAGLVAGLEFPGLKDGDSFATSSALCGLAAVVGHCYPAWHHFKGGKGAATAIGALCVVEPVALLPMLLAWLVVLGFTGWVGLSTMVAALSLVPVMLLIDAPRDALFFAIAVAAFLVFTHRSNIRKMRAGEEYRFEKARVIRWFR